MPNSTRALYPLCLTLPPPPPSPSHSTPFDFIEKQFYECQVKKKRYKKIIP